MTTTPWGMVAGRPVHRLAIGDGQGCIAALSEFGARLLALSIPDRAGVVADVVMGHDRPEDYATRINRATGATCGRHANRIAGARFVLDGQAAHLDANEGDTHLHGGRDGFDQAIWRIEAASATAVTFALTSPDGHMGYPGALEARVRYAFTAPLRFEIAMTAQVTGRPTVVNLINHAYYNMAGHDAGTVAGQVLRVAADRYIPSDARLLPLPGAPVPVADTPFDLRAPRLLHPADPPGAFDACFCIDPAPEDEPQAAFHDPASGRSLRLWTDQPGLHVYTAQHLPQGHPGKDGARLGPWAAVALETEHWPNAPNRPDFPSTRLDPGQTYRHRMLFDLRPV